MNSKLVSLGADFDLQVARPEMPKPNAHEGRFEVWNRDPLICTNTRKTPTVSFDKQVARDDK